MSQYCADAITDEQVLAFANAYNAARGQTRRVESLSEYREATVAAWRSGLAAVLFASPVVSLPESDTSPTNEEARE